MSDRILQKTAATISSPVLSGYGDIPTPLPDTATVTITRSDGTVLAAAATAPGLGSGTFSYSLTPTDTDKLDVLAVDWNVPAVGTTRTWVEIVGGFYFSVPEARTVKPLDNTTAYTAAQIEATRNSVEDAIEEYTGALVPRYTVDTLSGTNTSAGLALTRPYVRRIRSVTVDGTAMADSDFANLSTDGINLYGYRWTAGYGNIQVGYEHGLDRPPERLRRASLLLAKQWLISGPVDDRATSMSNTEGTYSLSTPGRGGSLFGVPEVDAAVQANMLPLVA